MQVEISHSRWRGRGHRGVSGAIAPLPQVLSTGSFYKVLATCYAYTDRRHLPLVPQVLAGQASIGCLRCSIFVHGILTRHR